jgi:dihydrofolate reductase
MSISIVAAVAENGIIGKDNKLPWKLSGDLKYFAKLTTGKTVVMGLNTYNSILSILGKPLPNRKSIILTFKPDPNIADQQMTSWDEIKKLAENEEIFIIGGASVYSQAIDLADKLYITRVHASPDGDTSFPEIAETKWQLKSMEMAEQQPKDEYSYTFEIYERTK